MKKVIMVLFSTIAVGFIFLNIANAKTETDLFKMACYFRKRKNGLFINGHYMPENRSKQVKETRD